MNSTSNPISTLINTVTTKINKFVNTFVEKARRVKNKFLGLFEDLRGPNPIKKISTKIKNALSFDNFNLMVTKISETLSITRISTSISKFLEKVNDYIFGLGEYKVN